MSIFVAGATGATGRLLVAELLDRDQQVKAVVRSSDRLPTAVRNHPGLTTTQASLLNLTDEELAEQVRGCSAVACCLGHHLTFKGVFGSPRRLVTDATRRLCHAIKASNAPRPCKFVLMSSAGVRNRVVAEQASFAQRCVIGLLRVGIPPHADNEEAAAYLQAEIGENDRLIEWAVVRPDGLIDRDSVTEYDLHASPTRSAIFNAGQTSRVNVGHFMADLITVAVVWQRWRGQMPVIYNKSSA